MSRNRQRHSTRERAQKPHPFIIVLFALVELGFPRVSIAEEFAIQVGIVQRFGEKAGDTLTLKPTQGSLVVEFLGGDGTTQTQQLPELKLEIVPKPLSELVLDERVVLSTHRSFENAEQDAKEWIDRGIEVEIAQPSDIWEVWAKREVYRSPLLRRLLVESLEQQGYEIAYLQNQVLDRKLQASWVADGFRYNRDTLDVTVSSGNIRAIDRDGERTYGGRMRLQPNAYGSYTLVNEVPIETYLRGVVPHEIGPNAPYEAVKAQAIIARTYAIRNLHRFSIDDYQLCADTHCQVYWGLDYTVKTADRAIEATAGQILTDEGEPIDALYSSTTGGVTAPYEDIWEGQARPYLTAVIDSVNAVWDLAAKPLNDEGNLRAFMALKDGFNESKWDTFRWREATSLKEMTEFLKRYYQRNNRSIDFSKIQSVEIVDRAVSGRILKMTITTDTGVIEIPNDEIRNAFYPPISTLFYIEPIYEEKDGNKTLWGYRFVGGGFGHGVGLSQTGAYHLADVGKSSREILAFYYPGTELKPLSELSVARENPDEIDR